MQTTPLKEAPLSMNERRWLKRPADVTFWHICRRHGAFLRQIRTWMVEGLHTLHLQWAKSKQMKPLASSAFTSAGSRWNCETSPSCVQVRRGGSGSLKMRHSGETRKRDFTSLSIFEAFDLRSTSSFSPSQIGSVCSDALSLIWLHERHTSKYGEATERTM